VCVAERGLFTATVTVHGRSAHASEPRQGVSAVEKAAKIVLALHGANFDDGEHELLGRPSCNVGMVQGGTGHNTVAESCILVVDRRILPGTSREDAEAGIRARIDAIDDPELRYDLEPGVFGEASEMDPDHPFVAQVRAAVESAVGRSTPVIGMTFSTDARFVRNQAGLPAVVCGPGDIAQAHTDDAVFAQLYATFTAG
jgi:succinyl-diaminopimelate desuccinylase